MTLFRDRDYLKDKFGDIYQVIGSLHLEQGIVALQKYKKIDPNHKMDDSVIIRREESILDKHHQFIHYWIQKDTGEKFIRILPNYSSKAANNSILNHPYSGYSNIFQKNLIMVPESEIRVHYEPKKRFQQILKTFEHGSFQEKQNLDNLERETIEVGILLNNEFGINLSAIGVTGSILWGSQHLHSDIDLNVYGNSEARKILNMPEKISSEKKGLRSIKKIELLPISEKMAIKTGLSMEECFEYLYYKNYLFFHNNRKVSITFVPDEFELASYPLYTRESRFINYEPITVRAKIISDKWGFVYPGLFEIETLEFVNSEKNFDLKITRLMVYEHEHVGYYRKGDIIEIKGLLQICEKVPSFSSFDLIDTAQILVGGFETFGNEYVRLIHEE